MKLTAQLNDQEHQVSIEKENSRVFAEINGRKYELEVSKPEADIYLLKFNNKIYEVFVSPQDESNDYQQVKVGAFDFKVKLIDPKRLRGTAAAAGADDGISEIKTAMPGKIVRILSAVGNQIKKGDGVIIVEAMKMQNEMKSPKDGTVKEIRFNEGETVNAGDVLAVIE